MARRIVVRNENDDIWVIDLDAKDVKELEGDEHKRMMKSLRFLQPRVRVQNAVYGDDIITQDPASMNHMYVDP